jgi:dihydrofolate reductase
MLLLCGKGAIPLATWERGKHHEKLVVVEFLTLDGIMQAPGAPDEDRSGGFAYGDWMVPYADEDLGRLITEWTQQASALLVGRGTYEIFAAHWPRVTDPQDVMPER